MLAQFISRRQYQTADSGLGSGNNWPHSLSMITRRRRAIDAAFSSTGFVVVVFFFWFRFLIRRSLIVWVLDRGPGLVFWCCCYCCCCCCWTCQLFNKNCCYKKLSPNIKKSTQFFSCIVGCSQHSESLGFIGHKRHAGGLRKSVNGFTISSLYPLHLRRLHFECTHLYALPETQKIWGPVYTTRPIQINSPINFCVFHICNAL